MKIFAVITTAAINPKGSYTLAVNEHTLRLVTTINSLDKKSI
jgi:hypothetical protein